MSASKDAKEKYGFKSLQEVSELSGWSTDVFRLWHKENPKRFKLVLFGLMVARLDLSAKYHGTISSAIDVIEKDGGMGDVANNLRELRYLLCKLNG